MKTAQAKSGTTTSFHIQPQKQENTLENDGGVVRNTFIAVVIALEHRGRRNEYFHLTFQQKKEQHRQRREQIAIKPAQSGNASIESTDSSLHSPKHRAVSPRRQNRMRLEMLRHRTRSDALLRKESRAQAASQGIVLSVSLGLYLQSSFDHYSGVGATMNAATSFPHHVSVTAPTDKLNPGVYFLHFKKPNITSI
uniref:Uncharacterized protein n=1 Tax=Ascaris lumbricoides TaxID=6252 RepID=A0A0M3IBF0_ASCLU